MGTYGSAILWLTANHNGEAGSVKIRYKQQKKLKKLIDEFDFSTLTIKGRSARGNIVSKHTIQSIQLKSLGVSTISGKDIWFDEDIQRLNEDGHGRYLGAFNPDDRILAIFKNGTYYTTTFDLSSKYQGELLRLEKLDTGKVWTALYYDGVLKRFYVKRFSFEVSDNAAVGIAPDTKGSYLVDLSDDLYPRFEVTFGGKSAHRLPEVFEAEGFIGKKGITAKGKMVHSLDVKSVRFIEPIAPPEPETPEQPDASEDASVSKTGGETASTIDNGEDGGFLPTTILTGKEAAGADVEVVEIEIEDKEPTLF